MAYLYWLHLKEHNLNEGYIGVSLTPKGRIYEHFRLLKNNKHENIHLQNAFKKYKKIIHRILLKASEEYCYEIEEKLRPTDHIGWNINKGGFKPPSQSGNIPWNKNRKFIWITNNEQEQTLNIDQNLPKGWKRGRLKTSTKNGGWSKGLTKETDERIKKFTGRKKGGTSWNKGLTKETDKRIAKGARAISKAVKGRIPWNKPKAYDLTLYFPLKSNVIKN